MKSADPQSGFEASLDEYLHGKLEGLTGHLLLEPIAGGQSNPTRSL